MLKIFKNNKGSTIVLFAITLTIIIGFSALVIDIGDVMVKHQQLQNAIDSAVLAATPELPDTAKATEVANKYIIDNGFTLDDVNPPVFSDSNTKMNIQGNKQVDFYFARIFGYDNTTTRSSAAAIYSTPGGAFDYVLFSGSSLTNLTINGTTGSIVDGNSHTNASFTTNGRNHTVTGNCEAVKTITVNGTGMNINHRIQNASFVDMPDFSETVKARAQAAGTYFPSGKTYTGSNINIDTPIYVDGDLTITSSNFTGKGCIVATGTITLIGSNTYNDSNSDAVCFYSKTKNITIVGNNINIQGVVYAPKGNILLNGSGQTINGRIIGNTIASNGYFTVRGTSQDLKSLPTSGSKLVN